MTKPSFPNWTNPYIHKVESLPSLLAPCYSGGPSPEEIAMFQGRSRPFTRMICEFGCGSGKHLTEIAALDPAAFFIGFELRYKRAYRTALKAHRRSLENLFVFRTDVSHISALVAEGTLDGVHVNFPDPWDKKRWADNLMLNNKMLESLYKLMKPEGFLSYKTDHAARFKEVVSLLTNHPGFGIEEQTENLHGAQRPAENVTTEFEDLFLSKKMRICRVRAKRFR